MVSFLEDYLLVLLVSFLVLIATAVFFPTTRSHRALGAASSPPTAELDRAHVPGHYPVKIFLTAPRPAE